MTTYVIGVLVVCAAIGAGILHRFGRAGAGALLGLLLGPVGLAFVALMYAHHKALEQERLSAHRLQAMLRATTRPPASKAATPIVATAVKGPPEPEPPSAPRDERECPFCAEPILKKARVCKHCGREVEPAG